jgi:hypothetical protein
LSSPVTEGPTTAPESHGEVAATPSHGEPAHTSFFLESTGASPLLLVLDYVGPSPDRWRPSEHRRHQENAAAPPAFTTSCHAVTRCSPTSPPFARHLSLTLLVLVLPPPLHLLARATVGRRTTARAPRTVTAPARPAALAAGPGRSQRPWAEF